MVFIFTRVSGHQGVVAASDNSAVEGAFWHPPFALMMDYLLLNLIAKL